jgi:hypothetical protein
LSNLRSHAFPLQARSACGRVAGVRWFFLLLCLTSFSLPVGAQEQERKLADRLLRPDMTLVNSAQDKKFAGADVTPVEKKFVAKSFSTVDDRTAKSFSSEKNFSVKRFETEKFTRAEQTPNTKAKAKMAFANAEFVTRKSTLVQTASDESKVAKTRDYTDSRPFIAKGTRQKILNQEDKPLTIDEIRELLNKSK